ncbi:restriction endonuclease subunit S [Azospira inquinata]|uniref:Restriction endonuclease subunit S n=1 Tax=Azospira inquinata TaxID=2785627 RepID=A0A975XTT6_9RHOO|nr:restriction endonuclease subunit S [Azospira inquinata]QWT46599.1 restriction endonuclease subunit S [Azospira inquinata]QWT48079.1 restriction endonuclease subunit S [Azospira inquinata]
MSSVPKSWIDIELSEVAQIIRGVTYKREQSASEPKEGLLPVLRATNISGVALTFDELVYVPSGSISTEQLLLQGDVVVASSSGSKEIVGKAGSFLGGSFKGSFGAFCTGIRPSALLSPTYFQYFFQTPSYRKSVSELSAGSNINNLKTGDLAAQRFPLPPAAEQTRIVAKLEELLSDLDAGVAELKAAQQKLVQYRQSLLKAAVEGALTAEWCQQNPPGETGAQLLQRILTERRARWETRQLAKFQAQGKPAPRDWLKKYPEPVQPDTTDLPELPEGWVWASVEQLGDVQLGRQRSPDKLKGISPTRYIRAANITEAGIDFSDVLKMDFSEQERNTFELHVGDVLLTEASGSAEHVGRPAIWPNVDGLYCFQNTVLRFQPQGVGSEFAFYSFLAMQKLGVFRRLSGGVGINHLSAGKFSRLPVALPSTDEQVEIVRALAVQFAAIEEQGQAIELSFKQSTAQRQNILRVAFSGQLVPQDPADEPASVLLERIRAERAAQVAPKKPRGRKVKEASHA